jgi:hypothetical protein
LGKFWCVFDRKIFIFFKALWNILWTFDAFYVWPSGTFGVHLVFPVLVSCTKKNLATLVETFSRFSSRPPTPQQQTFDDINRIKESRLSEQTWRQGDRIGRYFAHWAIVYSGQFFSITYEEHSFGHRSSAVKVLYYLWQELGWATLWATFITSSSGRPAWRPPSAEK